MGFFQRLLGLDIEKIDSPTYKEEYFKKNNHVLVDVRTQNEFRQGHIPGAKNIPLNTVSQQLNKIPRNKTIILVCQSGSRSASACRMLRDAGYEDCINLSGGMMRWRMSGNPVK